MQTNILASFCYNGQDFGLVNEDTIVQIGGAYIICWDTSRNQKTYIKSPRQNGYSQVTTSPNLGMIAATEYGLQPECHIYRSIDRELIHTFKMQTTLKCLASCFSRDGKYLLLIGGVPDFRISIFDLEKGELLTMPEYKLPFSWKNFLQVSFNPRNKNQFCILSDTTIYFYTVKPSFQSGGEAEGQDADGNFVHEQLVDAFRLDIEEFNNIDIPCPEEMTEPVSFTSLKWDPYNRVHLCTNLENLYQITSKSPQIEQTLALNGIPMTTIVTQKHIIIATDDGLISWYRIEPPYESMGDKDQDALAIKLLDEIDQEYNFSDQLRDENKAPVAYMHYSHSLKRIIIGTRNGVLARLAVEAEMLDEDEDDDDNQGDKEKKIIEMPLEVLGRFHTAGINGVRALANSSQIMTISDDLNVAIWEATNGKQISIIRQFVRPTSIDVSTDGKVAFIGSDAGAFRIYDVSNRALPRLINQLRFFDEVIPVNCINCSPDGKVVTVSSCESDLIFICSQRPEDEFEILGFIKMEGLVLSQKLVKSNGKLQAIAVLSNNLVQTVVLPTEKASNRLEPLPADVTEPAFKKVDRGTDLVHAHPEMDKYFVSGNDKFLKNYNELPQDKFEKIDWRKAPLQPSNEFQSHAMGIACSDYGNGSFVTGGKDGTLFTRNDGLYESYNAYNTHSVACGGITALCANQQTSICYTGGGDGSIFIVATGIADFPAQPQSAPLEGTDAIAKIKSQEPQYVDQMKLFKDIMLDEFNRTNEIKKEQFKKDIMIELNVIRGKLQNLLKENTKVTDIEKLERDEFVIDVQKQAQFTEEGENVCNEIRQEAEKTTLRLELLREKVIEKTWDKMQVQSTATQSIQGNKLLFNYSIRKREAKEQRVLDQIIMQRKIELRQKYARLEKQYKEALDEFEFSKEKEGYFMNRQATKPEFHEDDSIMLAAAEFAAKDAEKKARRDAEEMSKLQANQNDQEGKRKPYLKITKGRLGMKTKKKDPEEEARLARAMQQNQQRDIKGMEEMHWKVVHIKRDLEHLKKTLEEPNIYDLLYDSFELYTDKRKRAQIELLREVVFELKRDFNDEFKKLNQEKEDVLFQISEKNDQILELLENLKQEEEIKMPDKHPLEDPENIFKIDESEIKVEKFLTKAEREAAAEAERIRLEREAELQGDKVGTRGLKQMMGGTELIMKKEKNMLEMELVREDWMNQPEEEMSEDEKQRYKEFLQREKEFKEKQRKANEINLKKVKNEIEELKAKFEESLLSLYKKRLFYDSRIYEQELYIIRLIIMLHDIRETKSNCVKVEQEYLKIHERLQEKSAFLHNCHDQMIEFENKIKQDSQNAIKKQEDEVRAIASSAGLQGKNYMILFVRSGKPNARRQVTEQERAEMSGHIVELDPYSIIDKEEVDALIKVKEQEEKYDYETHKQGDVLPETFYKLVEERHGRIQINQSIENNNKRLNSLKDFIGFYETEKNKVQDEFEEVVSRKRKYEERSEKLKFNFEVIVYLKQGQVEIPPLPVATDYKDAILIQKHVIEDENAEIEARGQEKVQNMNSILKHKTTLKQVKCENQRLKLQILDFEERATDVQLYRVTKQTQEIIQGKHQKKDEEDKKRLDNQIKQLEENCTKRKAAINQAELKLQKEIREKTQENQQLETKAWKLKNNVTQRKQIINLRVSTNNDRASDPSTKIKQIAHQRKLLDVIKQQEEEIVFLKDELDRLRARTFPSFAHLQNKPEYPDER